MKRAVAQSGSALAWGARGRGFESRQPDHIFGKKDSQKFLLFGPIAAELPDLRNGGIEY
jgi:hypothetical protein